MFTHEEEVQIQKGILGKSLDWGFAVQIFQRELTLKDPITNFNNYLSEKESCSIIINCIYQGYQYLDLDPWLSGTPLEDIGIAEKLRLGKLGYAEAISKSKTAVGKLLISSELIDKKANETTITENYCPNGYFIYRNYYKQFPIVISKSEKDLVVKILLSLGEAFRSTKNIFLSNYFHKEYKTKECFFRQFIKKSKNIQAFYFYSPRYPIAHCIEEEDLKRMLMISIGPDYKIMPLATLTTGSIIPNIGKWDKQYLDKLRAYFNDTRVNYCLEVILLVKFGEMPSEKTQYTILDIFKKVICLRKINNSSIIKIFGLLWFEKKLIKEVKDKYLNDVLPIIERIRSESILEEILNNHIIVGEKAMRKVKSFGKKKFIELSSKIDDSSLSQLFQTRIY